MERFFQKTPKFQSTHSRSEDASPQQSQRENNCPKRSRLEINSNDLEADPGLRKKIISYHPNEVGNIRRAYWNKGACQPINHTFPLTKFGEKSRRFNRAWFSEYGCWLEYSIAKDAAYYLCCYLFKPDIGDESGGDSFVNIGYKNWNNKRGLGEHVGGVNSAHNQALSKCLALVDQNQHIETLLFKNSSQEKIDYRVRLEASVDCICYLLKQGLSFRGHDESEESSNRGNFIELLRFLAHHRGDIEAVVLENAPGNLKLTSPDTQKEIVNAAATETINAILKDIGNEFFSILVDESRDESVKEQMTVALRYVNEKGQVIECFLGIEHVTNTSSSSLKIAIDTLFARHKLSISRLRGQGYDGASNMQGEFNGLKALILKENKCAYNIHCFAHQLQLALVAVTNKHSDICWFFSSISTIVNVVGSSCKRRDTLRNIKANEVIEALNSGDLFSGRGLNQETCLTRSCETRWGSHYETLGSLIYMYSAVIGILEVIRDDGSDWKEKGDARGLLLVMKTFQFVFSLHLMKTVIAITNELSQALQRKEQNIVNALNLVELSKTRLQIMRVSGWNSFLDEVALFCGKHQINVHDMNDKYRVEGGSKRVGGNISNLRYYEVDLFNSVLHMQLQELNNRFIEKNSRLLICMACLSPNDSFSTFDKQKLLELVDFYPNDFSEAQRKIFLGDQLDMFILDMRSSSQFTELRGLGSLAQKMVETKRNEVYPLIYKLIKLVLVLPVATATVERVFSAMKILKNRLCNRMGDQFLNDSMIVYIESEKFKSISNEAIVQRYHTIKKRREQL